MGVPVTIVTGALGVGKTTALLDLFRHRPEGERWAVLVNEFGRVGIDGPSLSANGLLVREVAGGCICCTAGLALRVGLVRLLRELRPDRLLIEPSGVARPAGVIDALRSGGVHDSVELRAVITMVDPRVFNDPVRRSAETYTEQVMLADVLVANRSDEVPPGALARFRAIADDLEPPKLVVATTSHGRLDPAWLDLRPSPSQRRWAPSLSARGAGMALPEPAGPGRYASDGADAKGCGWVWPADVVFARQALEDALQHLVRPSQALPAGVVRLKGIFRTERAVLRVDASSERVQYEASPWRRDSRVEILTDATSEPDWDAVEAALVSCER